MPRLTSSRLATHVDGASSSRRPETLAVEEPFEIRVGGAPLTVTMRTPGDDMDLAVGFLLTEGLIASAGDVGAMRYCAGAVDGDVNTYNVLDVSLAPGVTPPAPEARRAFPTTSACGVCGKASIESIRTRSAYDLAADDDVMVAACTLAALPGRLREAQRVFERTGGLHAAGLFSAAGELLAVREDVGRHNAVDKVIGWAARQGRLPLRGAVLMVSGRASFELVQKAAIAGIPVLASVSAPSSLAVELAEETGMTLVGFLRGDSFNIYCGPERVGLGSNAL